MKKDYEMELMETLSEELALESIEYKEEVIALEKFGKFSTTEKAKKKALEMELDILEILRGEEL